jgi:hypothetical protein
MVIVIVGQQHVVDPAEAGSLRRGKNAIGIAAIIVGPPCIDKKRLPRRGDEESRLTAFYVDGIHAQIAVCRPCLTSKRRSRKSKNCPTPTTKCSRKNHNDSP